MNKRRLQQVDIPFKEEVNKDEEDFNDFKKKRILEYRIQRQRCKKQH
jgi:hypothetical protein